MTQREYGGFMTERQQRDNGTLSRFWSLFAPAYDFRYLQRWIYLPAQDEMIALLNTMESLRVVADIGCGTGILADRIEHETQATEVYGVDLSTGMLTQARARSAQVNWLTGSANRLPFDDGALDAVVTQSGWRIFHLKLRKFADPPI
jgi:ubiquinone/menaquinone biosynthesis C-methylase UbiE